ncbi:tyrosine-type recombinase/integrase [Singulisphaera sp. PoT]|uniref:tyrosine-type recombinase/integrase n=1 Tax=Singulisphaera sp. PoT TaxID=3411797 RepID=UPI003BF4CF04
MDDNARMVSDAEGEIVPASPAPIPAFAGSPAGDLRAQLGQAVAAWLLRTTSAQTRKAYRSDLDQFLAHAGIPAKAWDQLADIRPEHVAAWRDRLAAGGMTNASIRRKITCLRSLFSYLKTYGYTGANPAHSDFVAAPAVPRDGKTVGLSPADCRRFLEAPDASTPTGIRDRALLGVLAFSGCRVDELVKLRVRDYRTNGEHRILQITGKGGKERSTPLHIEAVERLAAWIEAAGIVHDANGPLFRPQKSARMQGRDGFRPKAMTTRAVEKLVKRYVASLGLDPNVVVHSFRVTALTTARERGSDIIDLQDFAGHADPRTTLSYIRTRDRLSKSPAYVLKY